MKLEDTTKGGMYGIVIVAEGLSDEGGTEAQATALAEGLSLIGHTTAFATRWPLNLHGERVARLRSAGVEVITPKWVGNRTAQLRVSSYNIRRAVRAGQFAMRRRTFPTPASLASDPEALRSRDHDVRVILVHKLRRWIRMHQPLPMVLHVLARHTAVLIPDLRRLGLPVVFSELGQPEYYTGSHETPAQVLGLAAITADSAEAARSLETREGRAIQVIPSIGGFPEPAMPSASNAARFVMVNRLHPQKNVDVAIQAMADAGDHAFLEVLGSGPSRGKLDQLVKSLELSDRVILRGATERAEVKGALDAADAFILASSTEGTPTSVLEAMSRARCVVALPVGGVPDLVRNGLEGLFFDGTARDLSAAMRRLSCEPGLARSLGNAARERWASHFSPEKIVRQYERVYDEVLSTG